MPTRERQSFEPLVVALAGEPDARGHEEAVALDQEIRGSYDPFTQTSSVPAYAGTNATVCAEGTGPIHFYDTTYPVDDD